MTAVLAALPGLGRRHATETAPDEAAAGSLDALLDRAAPLASTWAEHYDTVWALETSIARDASVWSAATARDIVRHIRTPHASLALQAAAVLAVGSGNLAATLLLLPQLQLLAALLLAAPGLLASASGMRLAVRYAGMVAQHRAGIPPFRARLQAELQRQALSAIDRRRERLAGPRRPIPRHSFSDLLPAQAQHIAAAWMRHLGEHDATVLRPEEASDPALRPQHAHVLSSGYVARVWSFTAETPDLELELLEDAAASSAKRPLLFSLSGFSEPVIARANRRGIALFSYGPWNGSLVARGTAAERYLRKGLRDADGGTP